MGEKINLKLVLMLATLLSLVSCGSRKVSIDRYKVSSVIEKVEEKHIKTEVDTKIENWTDFVQKKQTKDTSIKIDEVVIEDKDGNTTTLKNVEITDKEISDSVNVQSEEKTLQNAQTEAVERKKETAKIDEAKKNKKSDRQPPNYFNIILQIAAALAVIFIIYKKYRKWKLTKN